MLIVFLLKNRLYNFKVNYQIKISKIERLNHGVCYHNNVITLT